MTEYMSEEIMQRIDIYARKLRRLKVLRFMDYEDIRQELLCELLASMRGYDETKGVFTHFANAVLHHRYLMLLEKYNRMKTGSGIYQLEYADGEPYYWDNEAIDHTLEFLDLSRVLRWLPQRYRNVITLFQSHLSISEITQITGRPRSSIYADVDRSKQIIRSMFDGNLVHVLLKFGGNMNQLSMLEALTAMEVSLLETKNLMQLNQQLTELSGKVKTMKEKLDDGMNLRFAEVVKNNLRSESKDTGTTRFFDGAFQIIAEVPKKVTWDTEKMERILKQVPEEKRKSIIKTSYSIDERKYAEMSYEYQQLFKDARTVTPGKTKFQITSGDQS